MIKPSEVRGCFAGRPPGASTLTSITHTISASVEYYVPIRSIFIKNYNKSELDLEILQMQKKIHKILLRQNPTQFLQIKDLSILSKNIYYEILHNAGIEDHATTTHQVCILKKFF